MENYNGNGNGNGNGSQVFDWLQLVYQDNFTLGLLTDLGYMPGTGALAELDHNPITNALADEPGQDHAPKQAAPGSFVARMAERYGKDFNRTSLSKAATICQMLVFNNQGGPERDNKPKALRRHWYAWYKTKFAQPFAHQIGDWEDVNGVIVYNDIAWSQRLSQTYAYFVDRGAYWPDHCPECQATELVDNWHNPGFKDCQECGWSGALERVRCTYKDLWVEDASRMMARTNGDLFRKAHIIVAVEKDSLFADFEQAAKALGAKCVISGKGKSSKAAIEKMLRDHFGWTGQPKRRYHWSTETYTTYPPIFSQDTPIHVIHVSDHDYDGQAVIGPTFAQQLKRYTPWVKEARVGIMPEDLPGKGYDLAGQMYSVKLSNKGYTNWAAREALFLAECVNCGKTTLTKGTEQDGERYADSRTGMAWPYFCDHCGSGLATIYLTDKEIPTGPDGRKMHKPAIAYGLEVEAMTVADYRDLLVKALLTILDFDHIVERLRLETIAFDQMAAERIRDEMLRDNVSYQDLLKDFEELERKKKRFENAITRSIWPITAHQADAYPDQGDQPVEADYIRHVERADWGPWRPFSADIRTDMLIEDFQWHQDTFLAAWQREHYDDYDNDGNDYIDVNWS